MLGASAAGVAAALGARNAGFEGEIVLVDKDARLPYERPPLSKSLFDGASESEPVPIVPEATYADHDITLRLGSEATVLDPQLRRISLRDGTRLAADRVVIATGARPRRLPVPGAELQHILPLRTADDAARLGASMRAGGPLVLVGGGFIGLEVAAVARAAGLPVTVVEVAPLPLEPAVGSTVAELLLGLHRDQGVRFVLGATVASFQGRTQVEEVVLTDGQRLAAAVVVVGVGVTPNDGLVRELGIRGAGGVGVDRWGRTAHPWVLAAGDVACQPHPALERPGRIEHWDSAQKHGEATGSTAAGRLRSFAATPYVWSVQYDRMYQSFGRRRAGDELVLREGATCDQFLAFWLRGGRVAAAAGFDVPRDIRAARNLIERSSQVDPKDLRDSTVNLRQLSRAYSDER